MKTPHSLRVVALIALSLSTATIASAGVVTWDGGGADDSWSDALNWGGTAPGAGDLLFFGGTTRLTPTNDFAAGTIFNNIAFNSGAGAFNLSGNGIVITNAVTTISATGNPVGGSITNNSANNQTISLNTTFTRGRHHIQTSASSGALNISGTMTRNANTLVQFVKSGGNINLTGSGLANVNGILGGWAQLGNDWAALDGSGNVVAYTGYTSLAAAGSTVASSASSNVRSTQSGGSHTMAAAGITDINTFWWSPTTGGGNQTLDPGAGNVLRLGVYGGIFANGNNQNGNQILTVGSAVGNGTLTAGGADDTAGEITLYNAPVTGTRNNLVINSVIADNGSAAVSVNIFGYAQFNANAANTHSGGTHIIRGRAQAGSVTCFGYGPVYVYPGGQAFLNTPGHFTNDFYISGFGPNERAAGQGAIRGSGRTNTGTITLIGDAGLGGNEIIEGKITGTGNLYIGFQDSGNGTEQWNMTVANDYVGDTIILANSGATSAKLKTGAAANILPHGVGKGNFILNALSGKTATLDLGGFSQTINGLISAGNSPAENFVNSSVAGAVTLTLGDGDATATYAGIIQNGTGGPVGITKIGAGTQTFTGANTYTGPTTVNAGSLRITTAATGAGGYTVADDANLRVALASAGASINLGSLTLGSATGASLGVDTANFGNPSTTPIRVSSLTTPDGTTTTIRLLGTALTPGTFTVLTNTGARTGTGSFVLDVSPRVNATLNDDTANDRVTVTITSVDNAIQWDGTASGDWDVNNTGNNTWVAIPSGNPSYYLEDLAGNDAVRFDDAATGTSTVNITTNVAPPSLTVSNSAVTYTFTGPGKLTGPGGLTKQDAGALILANSGTNDFLGSVTVSGGTLQVGTGSTAGNLPSGSAISLNGTLVFNRSDNIAASGLISGNGTLVQRGSGLITVSGVNSGFTGTTVISNGTVRITGANSLGAIPGGNVIVTNGGTLDVGGAGSGNPQLFQTKQVYVAGTGVSENGAIINSSGTAQQNAFQRLTLTADATIGGPGRWDLRTSSPILDLAGYKLTKIGSGVATMVGGTITAGDIEINDGIFGIETASTVAAGGTITVNTGGILAHFGLVGGGLVRDVVLNGGTIQQRGGGGGGFGSTNDANISLTANSFLDVGNAAAQPLRIRGPISGGFGITTTNSSGAGSILLSGTNTYNGNTTVSAGTFGLEGGGSISASPVITVASGATFNVSARTDGTLTLASGQTLKGNGTVVGTTAVASGSTVSPGLSIGALTQTGALQLQGGGTNVVEVQNATGAAGVGYDTITVSGGIAVQSTSGNPFIVKLVSLGGDGLAGAVTNFNADSSYSWTIMGGTVSGFSADKFVLDTSDFVAADLAGGEFSLASGSLLLNYSANNAPTASNPTLERTAGLNGKIAIAALGSDIDGDAIALVSVSLTGTNGGTITTNGTYVFYTPGVNGDVTDEISYTIQDVRDYRPGDTVRTASGTILVTIAPPSDDQSQNITGIATLGDGNKQISFAGVPGYTYLVQAATNLTPPVDWVTLSTNVAGTNGLWNFADLEATNYPTRFYRSATP